MADLKGAMSSMSLIAAPPAAAPGIPLTYWDDPVQTLRAKREAIAAQVREKKKLARHQQQAIRAEVAADEELSPEQQQRLDSWRQKEVAAEFDDANAARRANLESYLAAVVVPKQLNQELRRAASNSATRARWSSRDDPLCQITDFLVLRLAGLPTKEIFARSLMKEGGPASGCPDCKGRLSTKDAGFIRHRKGRPGALHEYPLRPSVEFEHGLLAGGHYARFRRGAVGARFVLAGQFPTHVSYEALCAAWPNVPQTHGMLQFMLASTQSPAHTAVARADWKQYQEAIFLLFSRALAAPGSTRLFYLLGVNADVTEDVEPVSIVVDLDAERPGVYCDRSGFFVLKKGETIDRYMAWLLALLTMTPLSSTIDCYALQRQPAATPPEWLTVMDRHPAAIAALAGAGTAPPLSALVSSSAWEAPEVQALKKRKRDEEDHT